MLNEPTCGSLSTSWRAPIRLLLAAPALSGSSRRRVCRPSFPGSGCAADSLSTATAAAASAKHRGALAAAAAAAANERGGLPLLRWHRAPRRNLRGLTRRGREKDHQSLVDGWDGAQKAKSVATRAVLIAKPRTRLAVVRRDGDTSDGGGGAERWQWRTLSTAPIAMNTIRPRTAKMMAVIKMHGNEERLVSDSDRHVPVPRPCTGVLLKDR